MPAGGTRLLRSAVHHPAAEGVAMKLAVSLFAVAASTGLASAQLTVTATPAQAWSVTADDGSQVTSNSLPAGVSSNVGQIFTGQPGVASAAAMWQVLQSDSSAGIFLSVGASVVTTTPGASASKNASDIVLEFQPAGAVPCRIYAVPDVLQANNGIITWSIDYGDDGSIEYDHLSNPLPGDLLANALLGPQPLRIRIRTSVVQQVVGGSLFELNVWAVPDNHLQVSPALPGCESQQLTLLQSFTGRGLNWYATALSNPVVGVIGLDLQPVFLSPVFPTPCLLLPSPDLLVLLPPNPQFFHLSLPPAIRPVTFWTQGVSLTPLGLGTTNAFQIDAL
ncbi:MAG: hypothetical protein R3F29_14630 [Planctomycetota bacterium]